MLDTNRKVIIAGGGLVGSLQALLMGKKGFKVEVLESRVDMRLENISAGKSINLALANRGIVPLEKAGVMGIVKDIIIPMKGRMIHEVGAPENFQSYGQRPEEVVYSVSRGDLNKLLMTEAEKTGNVSFRFSHEVKSADLENKVITIKNGDKEFTQSYDLLIGTDGAGSPVRKSLLAHTKQQDNVEWLGHSYKELCILPNDDGSFKIDKESLHIWPRSDFMLIALPNPDGSFTVTLFMPTKGPVSFESIDSKEKVRAFFEKEFPDALEIIPDLEDLYMENPTGVLGTVKCYPWIYQDSVMLMGDAAHAIVPFHGQGMNCGFEDCGDFIDLFDTAGSWEELLSKYQEARKINGDAIADLAIDNYIVMRDSVRDERFLTKKKMGFELESKFPEKFIPRYSRVMFHHMPYSEAKRLGEVQDGILEELYDHYVAKGEINWQQAEKLIEERI